MRWVIRGSRLFSRFVAPARETTKYHVVLGEALKRLPSKRRRRGPGVPGAHGVYARSGCASLHPPIYVRDDRLHAKGWAADVAYPPV
jgi:hypothetical protein